MSLMLLALAETNMDSPRISDQVGSEIQERWSLQQIELISRLESKDRVSERVLRLIKGSDEVVLFGGVDLSFVDDLACACLVIISYPSLQIVYQDCQMFQLKHPYISGFLAFREAVPLHILLKEQKMRFPDLVPDLVLVDGNGILHPRSFGLACHLGVLVDIPTIGVAKKLMSVDGLVRDEVVSKCKDRLQKFGDTLDLVGQDRGLLGQAVRTGKSRNPVFVSSGHRISLQSAVQLVLLVSEMYRIPEPIRRADLISRDFIRKNTIDGVFNRNRHLIRVAA